MSNRYSELGTKIASVVAADSFYGAVSTTDVDTAELALGVKFPDSFKWFLTTYGAGNSPDFIYGLGSHVPRFLNVTSQTMDERNEVEPRLRAHLIPFSPDGAGNHWCLDTSRYDGGECPVVFWYHDRDNPPVPSVVAPTFLDWLEQLIHEHEEQ
jgi:cell wall assembly regulator SMI1